MLWVECWGQGWRQESRITEDEEEPRVSGTFFEGNKDILEADGVGYTVMNIEPLS